MKITSTAAAIAVLLGSASAKHRIDSKTRSIRDSHNRHQMFHGVNVVYKVDPYIPTDDGFDSQNSLSDEDIDNLVNWGFNFVRLGVMWEAVERAPGVYDQDYLDKVNELINKLGERGIYTLVDAHQDVLARDICGEGMPSFYAKDILNAGHTYIISPMVDFFVKPILNQFGVMKSIDDYHYEKDENGWPLIEECQKENFGMYYTSPESFTLFRAFYENTMGIQDKFVNYWEVVAKAFSSNQYVVGFDPLNEPLPSWTGIEDFVDTLLPGHYDEKKLAPMYERIHEKFMEVSKDNIMYFEGGQFPDMMGKIGPFNAIFNVGFKLPPGGAIGSENHVLNDHTYCCQVNPNLCADGEPPEGTDDVCYSFHQDRLSIRNGDAYRLGVPLIISEFGACLDTDVCAREIT